MTVDHTTFTDEEMLGMLRSPRAVGLLRASTPWMSPDEAAAYLGIAIGTLRNWTSARFIPFSKRGRIVRYHKDTIDKWLAKGGCTGRATLADT